MGAVFISYRRGETDGQARALHNELAARLGRDSVFMDVDSIALGRDFREALRERLASCDLMLALIGKDWINAKDQSGRRRLEDPSDFVRLEISSALRRNIPVTPVLLQGAGVPSEEELPDDLKDLAFRNGFELSHNRWDSDVQEMVKRLGLSTGARSSGAASKTPEVEGAGVVAQESPGRKVRLWWLASAILVLVVVGTMLLAYQKFARDQAEEIHRVERAREQAEAEAGRARAAAEAQAKAAAEAQRKMAATEAQAEARAEAERAKAAAEAQEAKNKSKYPNFGGTWGMFENTYNGTPGNVNTSPVVITQKGGEVTIGGRTLSIRDDGAISYQTFAAGPSPGHSVETASQADLIDTFTWRLDGSILVFVTVFDYRRAYGNHGPGRDQRIMKYRRVQ